MGLRAPENAGRGLLYEEVAAKMGGLIERGTLRPGDRMPSIRALSRQMRVSVSTVLEAYSRLEDQRIIEARPQSGYYVSGRLTRPKLIPTRVDLGEEPLQVMRSLSDPSLRFGR